MNKHSKDRSAIALLLSLSVLVFVIGLALSLVLPPIIGRGDFLESDVSETRLQTVKEIVLFILGVLSAYLIGDNAPQPGDAATSQVTEEEKEGPVKVHCQRCGNRFVDPREDDDDEIACPRCGNTWRE